MARYEHLPIYKQAMDVAVRGWLRRDEQKMPELTGWKCPVAGGPDKKR